MFWSLRLSIAAWLVLSPSLAWAGMPSMGLSQAGALRFQTISFFLIVFLVCAAVIRLLWNWLAKDFAWLPQLTYKKAVGLTALWGLLFVIVLTMISGARELMTPGAWEKNGSTYRLKSAALPSPAPLDAKTDNNATTVSPFAVDAISARRDRLAMLGIALRKFAQANGDKFPEDPRVAKVPDASWQVAEGSSNRYRYIPGRSLYGAALPLVYEPDSVDGERFVFFNDGETRLLPKEELNALLGSEERP